MANLVEEGNYHGPDGIVYKRGQRVVKVCFSRILQSHYSQRIMEATAVRQTGRDIGFSLFDTVPEDLMRFGHGAAFDAKKTAQFLSLKKADVSRIAAVAGASVRWDSNIPGSVRDRMEEIAATINLVHVLKQHHKKFFLLDANDNPCEIENPEEFLQLLTQRNQETLNQYHQLHQQLKSKE